MALSDTELAIAACKRLKWPSSKTLAVQSMIPAALSNLAKQTARDPARRNLLMTDPATVQATVTPGLAVSTTAAPQTGTVDLSSIVETYGVMVDTLRYGTIFHQYQVPFASGDVTTGAWPTGNIEIVGAQYVLTEALAVYLQTSGSLPNPFVEDTIYYILQENDLNYGLALSAALAEAGTGITINTAGSGDGTIYSKESLMQLLKSPNQGLATTCLPFSMLQGWLEGYLLNLKGIPFSSTFSKLLFNVPFIPTLETFPVDYDLEQDLLDTLVGVAASMGIQDEPPAD